MGSLIINKFPPNLLFLVPFLTIKLTLHKKIPCFCYILSCKCFDITFEGSFKKKISLSADILYQNKFYFLILVGPQKSSTGQALIRTWVSWLHPDLLPKWLLLLFILLRLTSSFASVVITTSTRGCHLARNANMGHDMLLEQSTYIY